MPRACSMRSPRRGFVCWMMPNARRTTLACRLPRRPRRESSRRVAQRRATSAPGASERKGAANLQPGLDRQFHKVTPRVSPQDAVPVVEPRVPVVPSRPLSAGDFGLSELPSSAPLSSYSEPLASFATASKSKWGSWSGGAIAGAAAGGVVVLLLLGIMLGRLFTASDVPEAPVELAKAKSEAPPRNVAPPAVPPDPDEIAAPMFIEPPKGSPEPPVATGRPPISVSGLGALRTARDSRCADGAVLAALSQAGR